MAGKGDYIDLHVNSGIVVVRASSMKIQIV